MDRFIRRADPNALGVRDLLEARDHYHVHIANLPTVIGTAIGRYRIRLADPNFKNENAERTGSDLGPRTLGNSEFRPWSWPCVLVFVSEWLDKTTLAKNPELAVPPVLYLPDGRQVRTCPVLVEARERNLPPADTAVYAADMFGPNFQMYVTDQGSTRVGVASAVVQDGAGAFVLTSRHLVAGAEPGSRVWALPRGKHFDVGAVTSRCVESVPLEEVYPGFNVAGRPSKITLDATLVRLDSVAATTSRYLGVGRMGSPVDLSSEKMSLNLIGCPLFTELPGGIRATGILHGLFYRHASVGGVDSLAEFLIGPRRTGESVETRPGDSGVTWFWDEEADSVTAKTASANAAVRESGKKSASSTEPSANRPFAIQWGGQGFLTPGSGTPTEFVLASSFSSVCKALEVSVVQGWNSGQSRYWGKLGHYNIGYAACFALQTDKAKAVFAANATSIGVRDEDLVAGHLPGAKQKTSFIALADVPDLVWRSSRGKDKANHFADMDEKGKGEFQGKTLLELWDSDETTRSPAVWDAFYESIDPSRKPQHRGALPFRVAQLFNVMVAAVAAKNLPEYVCAAGVLAHYIGDACQPLHVSHLHHGEVDDASDDKVHAVYEDAMLNQAAPEVVAGVKTRVAKQRRRQSLAGAMAAANAVVQLMRRTVEQLPPEEVLDVYNRVRGNGQAAAMWKELGNRTMDRMADGAVTLASVWQSAWTLGGGDALRTFSMQTCKTAVDTEALKRLYDNRSFAESLWLSEMPAM